MMHYIPFNFEFLLKATIGIVCRKRCTDLNCECKLSYSISICLGTKNYNSLICLSDLSNFVVCQICLSRSGLSEICHIWSEYCQICLSVLSNLSRSNLQYAFAKSACNSESEVLTLSVKCLEKL